MAHMLGSGALAEVAGPLKDFAEKLGSSEGPMWFSAFKRFLRRENPWALKLLRQMVLTIGGVARDELVKQLKDGGYPDYRWAYDIMGKSAFTTLSKPTEIELGWIKVKDLGFTREPTNKEFFARIRQIDGFCPAEVGPHLRLIDTDQQHGTAYWVAMEPITDSDGDPDIFHMERFNDGRKVLCASCVRPYDRQELESIFVIHLCE